MLTDVGILGMQSFEVMCVHIFDRDINILGWLSFDMMLAHIFTYILIF